MEHQDWKPVTWDKRYEKPKGMTDKAFLNDQKRKGNVTQVVKSTSANQNKDAMNVNTKKLEKEEIPTIKTVGMDMGKRISQARCEKKVTQKELANLLSLPVKTIQECENGKGVYNAQVINKLERYFGKRIRE